MAAERGRRLYLRWYTAAVGLSRQAPDEACGEQGEDDAAVGEPARTVFAEI